MTLRLAPNLADPDGAYARLLAAYRGLGDAEQAALSARLILILMNHIGDEAVLAEALALARETGS